MRDIFKFFIVILSFFLIAIVITVLQYKPQIIKTPGITPIPEEDTPYVKIGKPLLDQTESTPFVWDNELYYMVSQREIRGGTTGLRFYKFKENNAVYRFAEGYGLGSAFSQDDRIYVTASKGWGTKFSGLYLIECTKIDSCGEPKLIKQNDNYNIYNSSLTYNIDTKEYIIAYEVDESPYPTFSVKFLKSKDLINFEETGDLYGKDRYTACPSIRYLNGWYYMWYTAHENGLYIIRITKSQDLINWTEGDKIFMSPNEREDINTSDFDITEFQGKTYLFYAVSNQKTYSLTHYATFNSTIQNLIDLYF